MRVAWACTHSRSAQSSEEDLYESFKKRIQKREVAEHNFSKSGTGFTSFCCHAARTAPLTRSKQRRIAYRGRGGSMPLEPAMTPSSGVLAI